MSDHRQFQSSDVDMAFAESRPARHSQRSRNPFRAGDDFRGFLVHTFATACQIARPPVRIRSEEHTSELQSQSNLVCRLLLEKKKKNPHTDNIAKHLFHGYLNIYNNYLKAPWMSDRTEANPNELNQDDARYGFRCCHLKNIWTATLPPETELSRQMTTSTTSIDIMFFFFNNAAPPKIHHLPHLMPLPI